VTLPAPSAPADQRPARPPLVRPHTGRLIGGVAAGLAVHLGWPVRTVRIMLIGLSFASGAGVILYGWLWALVPTADVAGGAAAGAATAATPAAVPTTPTTPAAQAGAPPGAQTVAGATAPAAERRVAASRPSPPLGGHLGDIGLGAVLLLAAASVVGARFGWTPGPGVILPVLVVIAGAVLAYSQLDEVERSRWAARTGVGTRGAVLRVVAGLVIVLIGVLLVVVQRTDLASAGRALTAAAAVLGGTALVLAPWGVRLWRDLDAERAARIRETERAEIAAHLHDSVLQTLALIQRSSGDAAQVARLARAQERDLRGWLYGPRPTAVATLAGAVREASAEVEDRHGVAVELVVVGDEPMDDRAAALVAALREAMLNAVRHAGAPVSVYVEVGPDGVEAFVRDRGTGFDPSAVPPDRLGVRESIIGRMERHAGSAVVLSDDDGTEVRLRLPRAEPRPEQRVEPVREVTS
jgi:signal transduction histidine kinase/phage shock protein PspC (stress-responsive transcriptional regulator)